MRRIKHTLNDFRTTEQHNPKVVKGAHDQSLYAVDRPERYGKRTAEHLVREMGVNPFRVRYDQD